MPAVKLLHQVSDCKTKPEYIMGHSLQVVSVLVSAAATFFAGLWCNPPGWGKIERCLDSFRLKSFSLVAISTRRLW
ncbi:MAG: hypothetical protein FJW39_27470, partial [Acidobacteria bacterium]|nr:hypothetical protein [Acidobacteriota bacterium]